MVDSRIVKNLITVGVYMASIDLKDAYFVVPIHKRYRTYLKFVFKKNIFTCFPFGLSSAPYTFTKILSPVAEQLRSTGIFVCVLFRRFSSFWRN